MRKKIFIIHGKGVNRGIGKEGGGDLDTVSSNAFYMVWAPKVNKKAGDEKPTFLQVVNYLKRTQEFDYLVFSQGMMYRVVATLSSPFEREKGEFEPSLPLAADHFKSLNPDYFIYSEHVLNSVTS